MINPEVAIPLVVGLTAVGAGYVRWLRHRERMAEIAADAHRPMDESSRLAKLEQAVDAIALETERVGEGQRYLTRLMTDRAEQEGQMMRLRRPFEPSKTPH